MPIEKHDLRHDFPEYAAEIRELKMNDAHFVKLNGRYDEIDHEIHRIETGVENSSDEYLEKLKVERIHLKDTLFDMVKNQKTTA